MKEEKAVEKHPVEVIQEGNRDVITANSLQTLRNLYGSAFPARLEIERQILSKFQRLPGVPSSNLGLEALTGRLEDFSFESYLGFPGDNETAEPDVHSQREKRAGMTVGTN